ncbi:hypothetical protein PFISCL1PPCAC_26957, partial [Pristionchus fissidentatus]
LAVFSFFCLFFVVVPQGIVYSSVFCRAIGISGSKLEWIKKYKTLVDNLNKDKTLQAQITRATNFLNNNYKNLYTISGKDTLSGFVSGTQKSLETRWRITTYLKGLLAKIKPNLGASKFTEIKNLLWATDKSKKNNISYYYNTWKMEMLDAIPDAKKAKIRQVITNWESADNTFADDMKSWYPGKGFSGCGMN